MNAAHRLLCTLSVAGVTVVATSMTASTQLPSSSKPAEPERVSPPIPTGNSRLVLAAEYADTIYAATITVDVDAGGAALLSTLVLGGSAGEFNRKAITDWLRTTTFRPARRNRVPIRGTFRMTAEVLKQGDADSVAAPPG